MNSRKKQAKIAGWWYLFMGVTAGFGIMYTPLNIIVVNDAMETAKNIIEHGFMLRLSIVSLLIGQASFIYLVLTLNQLLKDVDQKYAKLMVYLVIAAVPIAFLNTLNLFAAQILVSGTDFLKVFEVSQLNAMALVFLQLYENGIIIVEIFWGLWLLPFGLLVYKSGFIPKILGIFLITGFVAYILESLNGILFPHLKEIVSLILILPLMASELSIILWLLIKGTKDK